MTDAIIRGASVLVTDWREEPLLDAWMLVADGGVVAVGAGSAPEAGESIDARGMVVVPGFVAAHHHLYQGISRGVHAPGSLIDWLEVHYRAWADMSANDVRLGATVSLSMALLGGCTTVAGFEYLHPPGEDFVTPVVNAADDIGIRLAYVRGCAPRLEGEIRDRLGAAGCDISRLVEPEDEALRRTAEVLARPKGERLRWAAGPTTPVIDDDGDFHRALDAVAREAGTSLHTHFHPIPGTCRVGESAFEMAERVGLVRAGNWLAHGSRLTTADVAAFGRHGVGVVHNPSCSVLLGYPTPPLPEWMAVNDAVAVSVDGAASNDRGGMLAEAQLAWQLQQARSALLPSPQANCPPSMALDAATRGGAAAIGWQGLGTLTPGSKADFAMWSIDDLEFGGAPLSARSTPEWLLLRCYSGSSARQVFVGGVPAVTDGRIVGMNVASVAHDAQIAASRLYGTGKEDT